MTVCMTGVRGHSTKYLTNSSPETVPNAAQDEISNVQGFGDVKCKYTTGYYIIGIFLLVPEYVRRGHLVYIDLCFS